MRGDSGVQDEVASIPVRRIIFNSPVTMISLRNILLYTLLVQLSAATSFSSKSGSSATAPSTCPSRTVNYITHGLPQQCLASSRPPITSPTSSLTSNITSGTPRNITADARQTVPLGNGSSLAYEDATTGSSAWQLPVTLTGESKSQTSTSTLQGSSSLSSPPTSATQFSSFTATDEAEADSLLDNDKFLSFEDWKKQNLVKVGQSEHVGAGRQSQHRDTGKRADLALHQGLDSLGDDAEIDLDFTGFVADRSDLTPPKQSPRAVPGDGGPEDEQKPPILKTTRSKDAGTTCKERYNHASFDCAATVLKTNVKAKGEKSILLENKDSYMLNECSVDNKFLILELCNDVQIDTIVLANFEFFSSIFRTFRVSVSDKYPVKTDKWKDLGTFEARNSREIQAFLVENPTFWARYVRIEFLTHYGNEFYCPLSLVRVHGTTMMEEYKRDIASAMAEEDSDDDATETLETLEAEETLVPEAVAQVLLEEQNRSEEAERAVHTPKATSAPVASEPENETLPEPEPAIKLSRMSNATSPNSQPKELFLYSQSAVCATSLSDDDPSASSAGYSTVSPIVESHTTKHLPAKTAISSTGINETAPTLSEVSDWKTSSEELTPSGIVTNATPLSTSNSTVLSVKPSNATASDKPKLSSSPTQPQPANPTVQESFFKSVQKRLQMLESNSSLSLQYIEEQSRALRDAFGKVEQRQLSKTSTFLDYLNATVLNELRDFRQQYDQLWQSTVIELESQREQYQQETIAINSRLAILADELIFQKRMSILQMFLILVCLGLVLFSRGTMHNYMDIPIVQSMLTRSPSSRWISVPSLQTPSTSPPQTRPSSSHLTKPITSVLKSHTRERSDDSMNSAIHHADEYSPLTPISQDGQFNIEDHVEHLQPESPGYDPSAIERPSTSPPILPSGDDNMTPDFVALPDESIDSRLLRTSETDVNDGSAELPEFSLRPATPPSKQLTFRLPER